MGIIAVFVAVAMFAFTSIPAKTTATEYFWYDASNGQQIGDDASELPDNGCQLSGSPVCAFGHLAPTGSPGTGDFVTAYYP